jgi:hypothetical protein
MHLDTTWIDSPIDILIRRISHSYEAIHRPPAATGRRIVQRSPHACRTLAWRYFEMCSSLIRLSPDDLDQFLPADITSTDQFQAQVSCREC